MTTTTTTKGKFAFHKATRKRARLRIALCAVSGAGKTWTALEIAKGLGGKTAVIDTERGSASLYGADFDFDTLELESFEPATYVEAIHAAEAAGYDTIIIDSLSHAWIGKGGALEQADRVAAKSFGGNTYYAWRNVTPMHNALVDAMLGSKCHIIATMRVKSKYDTGKDEKGKFQAKKVGVESIQRDGIEYEFTIVGDLDDEHNLTITKTRCRDLDGMRVYKPDAKIGQKLLEWLDSGEADAPAAQMAEKPKDDAKPAEEQSRVVLDDGAEVKGATEPTSDVSPWAADIAAIRTAADTRSRMLAASAANKKWKGNADANAEINAALKGGE